MQPEELLKFLEIFHLVYALGMCAMRHAAAAVLCVGRGLLRSVELISTCMQRGEENLKLKNYRKTIFPQS